MRDKFLVGLCCVCSLAIAQQVSTDTIAKPQSAKEKKKQDRKLRKELESPYRTWLDVDVAYIIADEERRAFVQLSNDEERDQFIEQFWLRRDPTPDTLENEFKEEHYRRIAYANEHFASGIAGWKTDRGRIYIVYGPPDEIDSHSSGGSYQQSPEEGGGQITTFPFERWRYRYLQGVGTNIVIEFVDQTMSGEYHLTIDPTEKNALQHTPMGQSQQQQNPALASSFRDEFEPLEQMHNLWKPPAIQYKDLEAMVKSDIRYNILPLRVRADYIPITPASIYTHITIQLDPKELEFREKDGVSKATVNLYARVTTVTRRVVTVFEDVLSVAASSATAATYQKMVPLAPGRYRLNIAAKDVAGGNTGTYEMVLDVPQFDEDKLSASSLILADQMERVPARRIGAGPFIIGDTKVRPRMNETFRAGEKLGIYVQLYHFAPDEKRHKPDGTVECEITRNETGQLVFDSVEEASGLEGSAAQVTVAEWLPLAGLSPGSYTLRMKVTDRNRHQTVSPSAIFSVIAP